MPAPPIPEIVKVTTTMIPALKNVRLIRGLIVPLSQAGSMNETQALDEYNKARDRKKREREDTRRKNNKRVIKVRDALQCVEQTLGDGRIAIAFGKALLSVITKSPSGAQDMMDILYGPVQECMIRKALQQGNRKSRGRYVKIRGPQIGTTEKYHLPPDSFSEVVRVRRGKLHPFIP